MILFYKWEEIARELQREKKERKERAIVRKKN